LLKDSPEFDYRLGIPREVFPTELTSDEEMERNLDEWRRMNVAPCQKTFRFSK
jgi:hypothetical protein